VASGGRTGRVEREVNPFAVLLLFPGAGLLAAARFGLRWYSVDVPRGGINVAGDSFTFTDLHQNAAALDATVSGWYFTWFGPTLAIAAVVLTAAANRPTRAADPLRVLAFLVAVLGLVATYYALAQLFNTQTAAGGSAHSVWHNSSYGLWAALAGFALLAVAGVIGPHRSA
jgi:hypothetical protein